MAFIVPLLARFVSCGVRQKLLNHKILQKSPSQSLRGRRRKKHSASGCVVSCVQAKLPEPEAKSKAKARLEKRRAHDEGTSFQALQEGCSSSGSDSSDGSARLGWPFGGDACAFSLLHCPLRSGGA